MSAGAQERKRAATLRERLVHHDHVYYTEGRSEVSDAEYDALYRELVELEAAHAELAVADSPTQRVGAALIAGQGLAKVEHEVPMLSIDSLFGKDEVREFVDRIVRFLGLENGDELEWSVEPKFDGVSASLIYEHGRLVRGVTRGNGRIGEDVTANLRTVRNIPLELEAGKTPLPELLEVRGEVLIQRDRFDAFNQRRVEAGEEPLANPRNATAGAIRRNDPAEVRRYPLEMYTWAAPRVEGPEFKTQGEINAALREWGLPFSGLARRVRGVEACLAYHADMEAKRDEIPFDMDGIVAKLDVLALRSRLGRTARAMRWQFAQKFAAQEATTRLLAIELSVGANGRLTPRAHVEPVEVAGVTVRHANLHNADYVKALDLYVGDRVFLRRAGDVIPQIMSVAEKAKGHAPKDWKKVLPGELRREDGEPRAGVHWKWRDEFLAPELCPSCGTAAVEEGKYWRCPNAWGCMPQLVGRTLVLTGRSAFDIDRIGEKQLLQLYESGLLETPADLFHLDDGDEPRARLLELERWGEKSVDNLFAQLRERRRIPFDRYLVALAIPDVGPATARLLSGQYASLDALVEAGEEELQRIDGIGPEVAGGIVSWVAAEDNRHLVERLASGGVEVQAAKPLIKSGAFADKTVVFTGSLEGMSRREAKQRVESEGGRVASSVSANTDFLVVGGKPGSKAKKAEEIGVEVLLEAAFLERLGDTAAEG